jgi:hypothetical protein
MTNKIYRSAQGKSVDLGTIMLQNEHVRAVGNMKVNARGDKLDSNNQVIDPKPQQIQRQNDRTSSVVSTAPIQTSSRKNRQTVADPVVRPVEPDNKPLTASDDLVANSLPDITNNRVALPPETTPIQTPTPAGPPSVDPVAGGLAEAIARSREIKQELEKSRRQQAQASGVRKI